MSESTAPLQRFTAHDHEHTPEKEVIATSPSETEDAWQNIARAAWTQNERLGATMPDISKQNLNEMLGLNFNPNTKAPVPYTNLASLGPGPGKSSIDWEALSRGETVVINPLPNRTLAPLDMRRPGSFEIPRLGAPDLRQGSGARLLDPVQDRSILLRVPDALYIGQKGNVTSTQNRGGDSQEYWLSGDAARSFAKAQEILAAKGKQIIVEGKNGAGRTVDTQTEIYNRSHGGRGFAAGKPTSSNHTLGRAMDVANYTDPDVKRALLAVGWRQGDSRGPIKNDLHHFSFAGTPQQDGPPRRSPHRR